MATYLCRLVPKAQSGREAHKDLQASMGLKAFKVCQDRKDQRGRKVIKATMARLGLPARRESKVRQAGKDRKAIKVFPTFRVLSNLLPTG